MLGCVRALWSRPTAARMCTHTHGRRVPLRRGHTHTHTRARARLAHGARRPQFVLQFVLQFVWHRSDITKIIMKAAAVGSLAPTEVRKSMISFSLVPQNSRVGSWKWLTLATSVMTPGRTCVHSGHEHGSCTRLAGADHDLVRPPRGGPGQPRQRRVGGHHRVNARWVGTTRRGAAKVARGGRARVAVLQHR